VVCADKNVFMGERISHTDVSAKLIVFMYAPPLFVCAKREFSYKIRTAAKLQAIRSAPRVPVVSRCYCISGPGMRLLMRMRSRGTAVSYSAAILLAYAFQPGAVLYFSRLADGTRISRSGCVPANTSLPNAGGVAALQIMTARFLQP